MQSGSAAPVFRDMTNKGMQTFFSPAEWKGLGRMTSRMSAFKNPFVRWGLTTGGAALGLPTGSTELGIVGMAGGFAADQLGASPQGRLFLERLATMGNRDVDMSVAAFIANPGIINATQVQQQSR